jgi:TPR repeat protein
MGFEAEVGYGVCDFRIIQQHCRTIHVRFFFILLFSVLFIQNARAEDAPEPAATTEEFETLLKLAESGDAVAQSRVSWYQKGADQKNYDAMHRLGLAYVHGEGVEQDYKKAYEIFAVCAYNNHTGCEYDIGVLFGEGKGTEKSSVSAGLQFRSAAEKGHTSAQFNLAIMLRDGEGMDVNSVEAAKFFRLAAEKGHASSQAYLGLMYLDGDGIPVDKVEAMRLLHLAADQGEEFAVGKLEELAKKK